MCSSTRVLRTSNVSLRASMSSPERKRLANAIQARSISVSTTLTEAPKSFSTASSWMFWSQAPRTSKGARVGRPLLRDAVAVVGDVHVLDDRGRGDVRRHARGGVELVAGRRADAARAVLGGALVDRVVVVGPVDVAAAPARGLPTLHLDHVAEDVAPHHARGIHRVPGGVVRVLGLADRGLLRAARRRETALRMARGSPEQERGRACSSDSPAQRTDRFPSPPPSCHPRQSIGPGARVRSDRSHAKRSVPRGNPLAPRDGDAAHMQVRDSGHDRQAGECEPASQRPRKWGARFSRSAARASRWSSLWKVTISSAVEGSKLVSSACFSAWFTACLV